jgi:peptidase propeptide and YPEB domain
MNNSGWPVRIWEAKDGKQITPNIGKIIVNPDGEIISIGIKYYDYVDNDINISEEKAKEIVQKDIEKDNNNKDKYSIKEGKTTLEYITKYQGNIAYKSYKIEVMYNSDKTPAREYYIDVNNGNIVNMSYYK